MNGDAGGLTQPDGSELAAGAAAVSAATTLAALAPVGATSEAELLARTAASLPGGGRAACCGEMAGGLMADGELAERCPNASEAMASTWPTSDARAVSGYCTIDNRHSSSRRMLECQGTIAPHLQDLATARLLFGCLCLEELVEDLQHKWMMYIMFQ